MLQLRKGGDVGKLVLALRGELPARSTDVRSVENAAEKQDNVDIFALLKQVASFGVAMDAVAGKSLEQELAYERLSIDRKHAAEE